MHAWLTLAELADRLGGVPAEPPPTPAQAVALGLQLQRLRERSGSSQETIAQAAGISRNHYQLLERGLSDRSRGTPANPRLSTLIALSRALSASVPDLLVDVVYADTRVSVVYARGSRGQPGR